MNVIERFLRYVSFDTQSAEDSDTVPTTAKQKLLGAALAQELTEIGLHGAKMDEYGYVYGWLPATAGCEGIPCVGLIAHMDTSPDAPGDGVKPQIIHYEGGDIPLSERVIMREADFESLKKYVLPVSELSYYISSFTKKLLIWLYRDSSSKMIMATPASGTGKYIQKRLSQGMDT